MGWDATEPPHRLLLNPAGKFQNLHCTVQSETVTVDASLIDVIAPLPTPDVPGVFWRQDDFAATDTGSGVVLEVVVNRRVSFSIPTVP